MCGGGGVVDSRRSLVSLSNHCGREHQRRGKDRKNQTYVTAATCKAPPPPQPSTRRETNVGSPLGKRRTRWPNVEPTLDHVFIC